MYTEVAGELTPKQLVMSSNLLVNEQSKMFLCISNKCII